MKMKRSQKILWVVFCILIVAIPVFAAGVMDGITPEKLSQGDAKYILSVMCFAEGAVIFALHMMHRRDWKERDKLDREDREKSNKLIQDIISKCEGK